MSKSRKPRPTRSQPATPEKDAIDTPARETEPGQTEIRSIVHQELSVARRYFFEGPLPHPDHAYNAVNLKKGYPLLEIRTPREISDDE